MTMKNLSVSDLKKTALIYWPVELAEKEKLSSIIPLLIQTQESFLSVLRIASKDPFAWITALDLCDELYSNLFLKHLCVLSDVGGENLKRFSSELTSDFYSKDFEFIFRNEIYNYQFMSLRNKRTKYVWNNPDLGLDGEGILKRYPLNQKIKDVIMLILFGGLANSINIPEEIEEKCIIGSMIGNVELLEEYVKQRYIWVSKITGGAKSNRMGQLAQEYIKEKLKLYLPTWDFSKKSILGISQNDGRTLTKFDIVGVPPNSQPPYWGIEVSFQFTTNSVVERKGKLARERREILNNQQHKVAYVVDGAGNFERASFIQDIIDFSDCVVNFNETDIQRLVKAMEDSIKNES